MKIQLKRQKDINSNKTNGFVALFLVSPQFKKQPECLVLEDMKMITCSNVQFIGLAMPWSEWYAWLQVEHGSIIISDHLQIPCKLVANLWKPLKSEIS